ncbi:transcriptional pleiotropic regulator of transition state genes [Paenibacillus algorifonticola]|uniref:Transcriptional pleiotropic regulator of transition state genes n=1 Tax=Paenibacillus algorifonticola TaxID=684063 RepID=A0A1I2GX31_9BACL|nr:AbrB/MazE/SpoVT family DNA-binding domain-containing protein [Paenibacillus algorifonticola]SFF22494.1 transcriptional pleiotropic regulator of transition state genes [Paenibacillus algorifonticola]
MKATGVVRKVDSLGRVVLPMELRRTFGIAEGDPLEIFVNGDSIVFKKYAPGCVISGSDEDLVMFQGKLYSRKAIKQLAAHAGI